VGERRSLSSNAFSHTQSEEGRVRSALLLRLHPHPAPQPEDGASSSAMTSADSLSLILRRLDEIERKLDRMLEELRTPTAIGYSARRGNRPRKD
jgi:hypothetical protein